MLTALLLAAALAEPPNLGQEGGPGGPDAASLASPSLNRVWRRLQDGSSTRNGLALLEHELFEARFEGIFQTSYRTAHEAALRAGRTWEWQP